MAVFRNVFSIFPIIWGIPVASINEKLTVITFQSRAKLCYSKTLERSVLHLYLSCQRRKKSQSQLPENDKWKKLIK